MNTLKKFGLAATFVAPFTLGVAKEVAAQADPVPTVTIPASAEFNPYEYPAKIEQSPKGQYYSVYAPDINVDTSKEDAPDISNTTILLGIIGVTSLGTIAYIANRKFNESTAHFGHEQGGLPSAPPNPEDNNML